eukprot:7491411-Pyramimonas_sp.AAC.1
MLCVTTTTGSLRAHAPRHWPQRVAQPQRYNTSRRVLAQLAGGGANILPSSRFLSACPRLFSFQ